MLRTSVIMENIMLYLLVKKLKKMIEVILPSHLSMSLLLCIKKAVLLSVSNTVYPTISRTLQGECGRF